MAEESRIQINLTALPDGVHRLDRVAGCRAFVKVRHGVSAGFFLAEARGLAALARAKAMRVPQVLAVSESAIALEDLGQGDPSPSAWESAGRGLAILHGSTHARFGFEASGWCGDSAQDNSWDADGWRFFARHRLMSQGRRAFDCGQLGSSDVTRLESICMRLPELLPQRPAALIHGDLWLGNMHACASGELALIDGGAVHYGWPECDLSMLTLFGEPPRAFFAAYEAAVGIDSQWRDRAPLLNLYHVLNHLNLFGNGYLGAVRGALARYA